MLTRSSRPFAMALRTAAFAGILAVAAGAADAVAQTEIKVGRTPGASGFHIPSYIAMDKGIFEEEGLKASFVTMQAAAMVTAGMGDAIDFIPIPGGGSQASLRGAPLRYVVGQSLISQWAIVVTPDIKTVADLKGKTLGYGRPASADYDEGEIVLAQNYNLNIGRDYKVISFQGEPERIAAMINGSINGALVSFPHAAKARVAGFDILLRTGDYLPRVGGTFWVTEKYLKANEDTVRRFIRAIAKSIDYLRHEREGSIEVIQKHFGVDDPKEAGFIWETVRTAFGPDIPQDLFLSLFEGRLERMKEQGLWPKDKPMPDIEQFVARDLLNSTLREMGYYLQAPPRVQGKM